MKKPTIKMSVMREPSSYDNVSFEDTKWLAKRGVLWAQNNLGYMYEHGYNGADEDEDKAEKWYRRAALQGHAEAQFNLGQMYIHKGERGREQGGSV